MLVICLQILIYRCWNQVFSIEPSLELSDRCNITFFFLFSSEDETGARENRPSQRDCSRLLHDAPDVHDPALEQAPRSPNLLEDEPSCHSGTGRTLGDGANRTHSPESKADQLIRLKNYSISSSPCLKNLFGIRFLYCRASKIN